MCSASADGGVRLPQKAPNSGVTLEPIAACAGDYINLVPGMNSLVQLNLVR